MAEDDLTLFYNDYSICSIMVRYTIAVGRHCHQQNQVNIIERPIDIQHGGQLAEYYLCDVNPRGTVPVLVSTSPANHHRRLKSPLTESLDITAFLGEHYYPTLYPPPFATQIKSLLAELHDIGYFSLTYTHKPQRAMDMEHSVHNVLADTQISARYRRALEGKLDVIRATRAPALTTEAVALEEFKTHELILKLEAQLAASEGAPKGVSASTWIFGTSEPTALDAHMVPFLARLVDVGRGGMFQDKERIKSYAERAFQSKTWMEVMQGRKTVYGTYL